MPTVPVDPAWHAFMLRSQAYAEFCAEHAGRYIHHVPFHDEAILSGDTLEATIPALEATGYKVDLEVWRVEARAECALVAIKTCCWPSYSQWLVGGMIVFMAVVGTSGSCH
ncbi:hypothetical protein ACFHW2_31490 [Actinomadura sp. LOL_016]|uniref:hypothetical protein n=1 Tax=unclassified Actinomadura TaxID=2626254 RepID=UPI003A80C6AA